jgi:hypothetical protein
VKKFRHSIFVVLLKKPSEEVTFAQTRGELVFGIGEMAFFEEERSQTAPSHPQNKKRRKGNRSNFAKNVRNRFSCDSVSGEDGNAPFGRCPDLLT